MKITQEESNQMTGMFNWYADKKDGQRMALTQFKQYRQNEKKYVLMYEITVHDFIENRWVHRRGTGESLMAAMQDLSSKL